MTNNPASPNAPNEQDNKAKFPGAQPDKAAPQPAQPGLTPATPDAVKT